MTLAGLARHWRQAAVTASDAQVLAAVVALSADYRAPSTSLITWRLAGGARVTAGLESAVRESLQRLHSSGELVCVIYRGTYRWSPPGAAG